MEKKWTEFEVENYHRVLKCEGEDSFPIANTEVTTAIRMII